MSELGELVAALNKAARLAEAIKVKASDEDEGLAYQAMMWSEYLRTFEREAQIQAAR